MPDYFPDFLARTNNPINSRFLYNSRRWYKEQTTRIFNDFNNNYIDLWYDVPYYGKVDREGILKTPKSNLLKNSAKNNITSFDFVIQAYEEMKFFLQRGSSQGRTNLRSLLGDFKVKRSFEDSTTEYLNYSLAVMNTFNDYIVRTEKKIIDLEGYINEFLKFLRFSKGLFSYYSIFAGFKTSIRATGLAIELTTSSHDNDIEKNNFFKNPEFYKYVQTAANFGFRINKNAPWMLIADLNSEPMLVGRKIKRNGKIVEVSGYMPQNFVPSINFLFDEYYDRAITKSFTLLRSSILYGYQKYQKRVLYIIDHGEPIFSPNENFKTITGAGVERTPARRFDIENYKTSKSLNRNSQFFDISDIENFPKFNDAFFISILEKILKCEFPHKSALRYEEFRKAFDNKKMNGALSPELLTMLENYYNTTAIFDERTRNPLWTLPQINLTSEKTNNMIPDEKEKPTVEKIVTEFYTGK